MVQKLKNFYHKYENILLVRWLVRLFKALRNYVKNTGAGMRLLRLKLQTKDHGRPIRVCFVQQDPNCWNKSEALYRLMLADERFEVKLLCVPDPFDSNTESTYRYFAQRDYDCIDARVGDGPWSTMDSQGEWFDLQSLKSDYVFYQQPYDEYLPNVYRSGVVSGYTRICMMSYGIPLTEKLLECMHLSFVRNVYTQYAVTEDERRYVGDFFSWSKWFGLRKVVCYGPAGLAAFCQEKGKESPSWVFSKNDFRIIWTPRWSTDEQIGGSNFFRYKDFLPEYAERNPDVDILFRPHPMAFDNFVKNGQMTQAEVDAYISSNNSRSNTAMDAEKSYGASFWQSSVLVADISAVLVEYFITGKPIIFCQTENCVSNYLPFFQDILSVCYVARNQEELEQRLNQLKSGQDPMQQDREKMLRKLFGSGVDQIPKRILQDLIEDYYGKKN